MQQILWKCAAPRAGAGRYVEALSASRAAEARAFHRGFSQYAPTPLRELSKMAARLGIGRLCVKDESLRFGLNAFKVLGGSYAIAKAMESSPFAEPVFFTATDGNHGRGVAWAARELGKKAVVCMPRGTAMSRVENIRKLGATVTVEDMNYDDCVRLAAKRAAETPGGIVVQDTAWEGYEEIPLRIMQGYGTMAIEADEQLGEPPTHVFLQAGVGSMAASVAAYFRTRYPENPPKAIVLEAVNADCFYQSALAGEMRKVGGELNTTMAGLACGEPNPIAWDVLNATACAYLSCPDWVSARGMRMLASPIPGDPRVTSGESGAVGMGAICAIMAREEYRALREALRFDSRSRVLLFSTEGDTDPENYEAVNWGGKYPTP